MGLTFLGSLGTRPKGRHTAAWCSCVLPDYYCRLRLLCVFVVELCVAFGIVFGVGSCVGIDVIVLLLCWVLYVCG